MADIYRDFVFTRNTVQVTDLDTTIQVEDVSLFPSNAVLAKGEYYIAFDSTLTYPHFFEIVRLTSVNVSTKTLTVVRGQAGTTPVPHPIVTYIKGTLSSDQVRRARAGLSGTTAPTPDADVFLVGDRFYHATEGRYYVFSGNASFLRDSFTRAASTTTMGSTEVQTVVGEVNSVLAPAASQVVPYVAPWFPSGNNIFGINANNQAYLVSGVAGANSVVNVGSTDFDITLDVFMSTTTTSDYGIFFRVDADQRYGYYLQFLNTTATLFRLSNGSFTAIASQTTSYVNNAIRTWRVWVEGNLIRIFRTDASGASNLGINYTETVTGFTLGSATYRPGAHVGIRYGNAAAVTDTAIVWDSFTCTHPGQVGHNNPKPQGWAPTSSGVVGPNDSATHALRQLRRVQADLGAVATQADEMVAVEQGLESVSTSQGRDISLIAHQFDEFLEIYRSQPTDQDKLTSAFNAAAATIDDIIDILSTLVRSGDGPPAGTPRDAEVWLDRAGRSIYSGVNGAWVRLTYSGPGAVIPPVSFVDVTSTNSGTGILPATAGAGDIAFALFNTVNSSSSPTAPTGWTQLQNGSPVSQYYNSYCLAYKILTSADIAASTFGFNTVNTTGQTVTRVYRNASFGVHAGAQGTGGNPTTVSTPALATQAGHTVVTWFSVGQNNSNAAFLAPLQNNQHARMNNLALQGSQDEIATGTTATVRQMRYTTGDNASAWSISTFSLIESGGILLNPAFRVGSGVPTDAPAVGTVHLDSASFAAYVYTGTEWVGVNRRVVKPSGDYTARGNDYVLAKTSKQGEFDVSTFNVGTGSPTTAAITTTKADCLIVGLRATWQGSGFTATLNGSPMTLRRRQYTGGTNSGPDSSLFTADTLVQPGLQTVSFSGGTQFGIAWATALAFAGVSTTNAVYVGQGNSPTSGTLAIPLPAGGPGFVYLYSQINGGSTPSMSNGGGLTWTARGSQSHGSQNASTQWTAPYTAQQAGTTITVVTTTNSDWQSIQAGVFPAVGESAVFDPNAVAIITLPTPAVGTQVVVQSIDIASNLVRVQPSSGLINGAALDLLEAQYAGGTYTADGTNWLKLSSGGGASGRVVTKTAAYTGKTGEVVLANAAAGGFTVTLPPTVLNNMLTVKKTDGTGNAVIIAPASGLIDGAANAAITSQYDALSFYCDGTNWWIF